MPHHASGSHPLKDVPSPPLPPARSPQHPPQQGASFWAHWARHPQVLDPLPLMNSLWCPAPPQATPGFLPAPGTNTPQHPQGTEAFPATQRPIPTPSVGQWPHPVRPQVPPSCICPRPEQVTTGLAGAESIPDVPPPGHPGLSRPLFGEQSPPFPQVDPPGAGTPTARPVPTRLRLSPWLQEAPAEDAGRFHNKSFN